MERSNDTVVGINKKGERRTFSRISWDLAHDGWTEVVEQPLTNVLPPATKQRPNIGNTQKINNLVKDGIEVKEPIKNEEPKTDAVIATEVSKEQKDEFYARAKGLNAGPIKDYFENAVPPIAYDKRSHKPELIEKLGEVLNFNVIEFQKIFG